MIRKILFICKGHQNIAGAQLYLKHVAEVFPSDVFELHYAFQAKDGTRVFDEIEKERDLKRWEYDWRHLSFFDSFKQALALLKKIKPEFVLFNSNEDKIIPSLFAARFCGIKNKVMMVHWALDESSLPLLTKNNRLQIPLPSRYALIVRTKRFIAYSILDKLIFVNTVTRKAFSKLYRVHLGKCMTIYNGVDVDTFCRNKNVRERMRADFGVLENEIMILAAGNLSPVKGHEVLVKAMAYLVEQGKLVKCFIAGQGELRGDLERLINQKQLARKCKLLGYRDDIPELLSAADIFCMPSLNEALGYSLIEAMATGKPVVASKVGGIPEVVTDSVEGFLVQPGSSEKLCAAISKLIENRPLRVKMGKKGVYKVKDKFSRRAMIRITSDFLNVGYSESTPKD